MPDATIVLTAAVAAAAALLVSPYLAALTISVPDRDTTRWWKVRPQGGARCVATGALAVVLSALAGAAAGWTGAWPAYLVLAFAGAVLSIVDVEHHRLPDRLLGPAAGTAALVFVLVAIADSGWHQLARTALAAALTFAALTVVVLIAPAGLGFGDVKLAAVVAGCLAWHSWRAAAAGLMLGVVLAGVVAVVVLIVRHGGAKSYVPLGPFLVVAALVIAAVPS